MALYTKICSLSMQNAKKPTTRKTGTSASFYFDCRQCAYALALLQKSALVLGHDITVGVFAVMKIARNAFEPESESAHFSEGVFEKFLAVRLLQDPPARF